jgi:cytochrome c-type biogenesis protein CcmH/NrfF
MKNLSLNAGGNARHRIWAALISAFSCKRMFLPALWLGLLLMPTLGLAQKDISREYQEACDRLVCQCGCNEQLSVCAMQNCSSATPMRAEIRERLQKGEDLDQIVQSFVERYGPKVLSAPTMKGFDITAWIMPFIILLLGTIVVSWIAVKMARPAAVAAGQVPVATDPRIEKELKNFEEES